mgnify:CR=1 FL=1
MEAFQRHMAAYVSDLDGTLLGSDSRVSQRSAELITELSARGALITVATARTGTGGPRWKRFSATWRRSSQKLSSARLSVFPEW